MIVYFSAISVKAINSRVYIVKTTCFKAIYGAVSVDINVVWIVLLSKIHFIHSFTRMYRQKQKSFSAFESPILKESFR